MTWQTDNMFLSGPYAPWHVEGEAFDLEVTGQIPAELHGVLYRVGSSQKYRPIDPDRYHWFDGDGMVHAVFLRDGRATYRNRWVETAGLQAERARHQALFGSFINGGAPIAPPAGRDAPPPFKNPVNTNVTVFDGRLLAFSEGGLPHELDPATLRTRGQYDFCGSVEGAVTAHWKVDPDNGDLLFYGTSGQYITWYRADRTGKLLESHQFDIGVSSLQHDFTATADYAVFLISPTIGRFENLFAGKPALSWDPAAIGGNSRFAVMSRATGAVQYIEARGAFGATHYYNAFQRAGRIIVDGQRVERYGIPNAELDRYSGGKASNEWFTSMYATPWRWELDLATGVATDGPVSDVQGELPRINDNRSGKEHRVGYFAATRHRGEWFTDGIGKHDYLSGNTEVAELGGDLTAPSEPVFVARENPQSEDDGWILAYWWDSARDRSELVIHDARDLTGSPVARIEIPHRVPLGFHGNWVPAAEIPGAITDHQS